MNIRPAPAKMANMAIERTVILCRTPIRRSARTARYPCGQTGPASNSARVRASSRRPIRIPAPIPAETVKGGAQRYQTAGANSNERGSVMINSKVFKDIGFVAIGFPGEYKAEFKVYNMAGIDPDSGTPLLQRADAHAWPAPTEDISIAELYLHGTVKWDGCSDWHFDYPETLCHHGCDREDLVALGEVMARCWDWAAELCEHWGPF